MKKVIVLIATLVSSAAFAGTDVWEGSGSLFDLQGQPAGDYQLVVENTTSGNEIQNLVTVTLADGSFKKLQCIMTKSGDGWTSICDQGQGGGHCFGEGLCISYVADATGKAFATTIVMDGPSDMRLLRTELQNGQAVRFFREKLHKK